MRVDELGDLLLGEGVLEGEHADRVADLGEALGRGGADLLGGAVGALELGKGASIAALRRFSAS